MKRLLSLGMLALLLVVLPALAQDATPTPPPAATPTPLPRPNPASSVTVDGVTLELYFTSIPQGQVGLLRVFGDGVGGARARFLNTVLDFFAGDDGFYCLLAVNMETRPRANDLAVFAWRGDDPDNTARITLNASVEVTQGRFIRQDVNVPPERAYLLDPEVERSEFARLDALLTMLTPERLWDGAFQFPLASELTSPFGAYRVFNQTFQTRHTGWDLRAPVGQPINASAGGTVVFAALLDIRGNYVLIDHGAGVFSGYAHLSQIHVTRGQSVVAGQIIGVTGDSGRSNGPHLHWEIAVNGNWVDSVAFMQMWLPGMGG